VREIVRKEAIIVICAVFVLGICVGSGNASPIRELESTWGNPAEVVKMENGMEKRYYKYGNTMDLGYRVFLIKGNEVTDLGLTSSIDKNKEAIKTAGIPVVEWTKSYWASHPTNVEAVFGKPSAIRKLDNGMVEYYYLTSITYQFFLTKGGIIVAAGNAVPIPSDMKAAKNAPQTISILRNKNMTLQDVEAIWGKPVKIESLDNGLQKRSYKYENTMDLGYRFFLVQDGNIVGDGTI